MLHNKRLIIVFVAFVVGSTLQLVILQMYASEASQLSSGGIDWYGAVRCHTLSLKTPCDELVTSDNQLTDKANSLGLLWWGLLLPVVDPTTASQLYALGKKYVLNNVRIFSQPTLNVKV
jgi:hypothetical protein